MILKIAKHQIIFVILVVIMNLVLLKLLKDLIAITVNVVEIEHIMDGKQLNDYYIFLPYYI